uniref:immunoglobulin-like domain-containing receptor 2 isoform X2 n=1 Tax=Doryrhamphus excisus TaxID=161450 RepID=UPI0025AE122E|nr:immunoglobulin-like domain-containing receptor 2 isoform X2 [Doryrhamphus excisus]
MNLYLLALLVAALACACDGVHVTVREKQQFAMLFQSVVLPCQYQTASTQTPVVQWWYKSYCRDRTWESFGLPQTFSVRTLALGANSQMDCSDSSRTVRVVASAQGASLTLAEHYKNRDITIINKADLRIGELQWGDSGVYYCKVVIADDLEGKNEAQLELLVLEWVFVGCVAVGSFLFLVLLGICWCQCCPHSCCCYVRCCCCPETCCCPQHLYEAGKKAKTASPAPVPVYPYYIPGVSSVMPLAPSSHLDSKAVSVPSVESNLAGASSLSELSSLHEGGTADFRHTYQAVQMKALPPIVDTDDQSMLTPTHSRRQRLRERGNHSDDELDRRWNARSEHLQRQTLSKRGHTGSLDELEEFARSYGSRRRRLEPPEVRDYSPLRRFYRDEDDSWSRRSPLPLPPQKRRGTWDSELAARPSRPRDYDNAFLNHALERKAPGSGRDRGRTDEDSDTPSKGSSRGKGSSYYSCSLSNRPEDEDPLPPYSEREAERYRRAGPTLDWYRTGESVRTERYDTLEPGLRPFSYTRPQQGMAPMLQGGREEADRRRKLSTALSRDSLLV